MIFTLTKYINYDKLLCYNQFFLKLCIFKSPDIIHHAYKQTTDKKGEKKMKKYNFFIFMVAIYFAMAVLAGLAGVFSEMIKEYELATLLSLPFGLIIGLSLGGVFPMKITLKEEKGFVCLMGGLLLWIVAGLLSNEVQFFQRILLIAEFALTVITFFILGNWEETSLGD